MRQTGLILTILSIVVVFFHYNLAIFIFGFALLSFGGYQLQLHNKKMAYVYFISSLIFIVGTLIIGFQ